MPQPIAVKLRSLREQRGLTQKEAAELAHVHFETLRRLESGEQPPLHAYTDEDSQGLRGIHRGGGRGVK
jgi:transcriptional regulator with XRE-family HTH domain